jgi:tetratricopeptide (TPR) repeat protein
VREQNGAAKFFFLGRLLQMTASSGLRFAGVALLFFLMACPRAFAMGQESSDAARAISAEIRARNYQGALDLCRAALEKSPKDTRLLVMEGFAYSGLGKQKEALGAYNAALKISPDFLPALEGAAQIEYNEGDARAEATLKHLLTLRPDEPTSHAMMAVVLYKKNDCKGAVEHFEKSAQLIETQPAALEQYGSCLVQLQRPADAIPIFERALAANADDKRARYDLAETQLLAQKSADAIATLQPMIEGDKPDAAALDLAAQAQEDLDNTPEAVKLLRQAIILDPKNPGYYLDFATLSFNHTSYQVGVDMLNVGLQQIPNSAELYGARGILYIQMAEYEKGESDLETAQRLDPKQTFSADAQGLSELQAHSPEDALAKVRARLKMHPNDAFLHFLLAQILVQSGAALGSPEYAEALREGERALALNPKLTAARDLLGDLYLKAGQNAKSVAQSREALKEDPSDQAALYHLVQALRTTDKKGEIPDLLKRLAALREETRKQEAAKSRYKLTEPGQDSPEGNSHY